MAVIKIDPMKLSGPWADGYVLECQHTLSSEFLEHDSFGNPQFDTKRSELGELVFRLKNRNDKNALDSIADTAVRFIQGWNPSFRLDRSDASVSEARPYQLWSRSRRQSGRGCRSR